jgi:hypothetical protein
MSAGSRQRQQLAGNASANMNDSVADTRWLQQTCTTTEELLEAVFSVRFGPKLRNKDTIKRVLRWQLEQ